MEKKQDSGGACPKCKAKMRQSFSSISGNSKFITFSCTACGYKETKCTGLVPANEQY